VTPADPEREQIAHALHPVLAASVLDGTAEVNAYPVPGLQEDAVRRVRLESLDHPVQAYVGIWPDGGARTLSDDQPAFFALVDAVGAVIDEPEVALGYVLAFLEVTRGPSVVVRAITDAGEIRWRPGSPDEEARRESFLTGPPVEPPRVEATGDGFEVELWLVVDQRIQRNSFQVRHDGLLSAEHRVVAQDLPLPIAL
jgi:hypothetical protein